MGLRKVVKLRVYDLPQKKSTLNVEESNEIAFGYSWRNRYYLGEEEIHKSAPYSSENKQKQPLLMRITGQECNNEHLRQIVGKLIDSEKSIEQEIAKSNARMMNEQTAQDETGVRRVGADGYIYYVNKDGSLISYFGSHIEEFEKIILRKSLSNRLKK